MNPLLEVIIYCVSGAFVLSGVMAMLAAYEAYEIDGIMEGETNWPAMIVGAVVAFIGGAILWAMRWAA